MTSLSIENRVSYQPLRLWPGVVAVVLQWLAWLVLPMVVPEAKLYGLLGGIAGGGLVIILWWLFFSRAPWRERVGALVLMLVVLFTTSFLVDKSIAGAGMGVLLYMLAIPVLCLALVIWAVGTRYLPRATRHTSLIATILLGCGVFTLIRTGGMSGDGDLDLHWRWTTTPEERLLAQAKNETTSVPTLGSTTTTAVWPGFRGPERDGVVRGLKIATDWSQSKPVELWRRPIGPGWSSFAVHGDLLYTQEQRGEEEIVACYSVSTGQPVWKHGDKARFWESAGGAGPRATPTYSNGRIYALGATGILNALDAGTGKVIWSRNAATDTSAKDPGWGFAGSPLVINDLVIVATSGRLVAYDLATGQPRWLGPTGGTGYSSPHIATIDGVAQLLLIRGAKTISVEPVKGTLLWEHTWQTGSVGFLQPAVITNGDVLTTAGEAMGGIGIRRLAVKQNSGGWTVEERWTSRGLKPYFSDFVVHQGHAFGFDGSILACIDLTDGTRKWKGGRYGQGQLVLLPEQDVLLVLSEAGELALVGATPGQFKELTRSPAIQGKTWNHPVLVGDVLLVRNGEEMAAFRLPLTGR